MDGKLNKFVQWIDSIVFSDETMFSNDIDCFIDVCRKNEWLLLGFSLWTLAKEELKSRGEVFDVVLCFSLAEIRTPNNPPQRMSDRLFRDVMTPPTIYVSKDKSYFPQLFRERMAGYRKLDTKELGITCDCHSYYYENKEEYENGENIYYRHIMFM